MVMHQQQFRRWSHHHQWFRRYHPDKQLELWTSALTLTWTNQSNLFIGHVGLWWSTIKLSFGCKRIISSEVIIETVVSWLYKPSLWPWPWRVHPHFIPWHSGSWYASPYQVWWQEVERFRRYLLDKAQTHTHTQWFQYKPTPIPHLTLVGGVGGGGNKFDYVTWVSYQLILISF